MKNEAQIKDLARKCLETMMADLKARLPEIGEEEIDNFRTHLAAEVLSDGFSRVYRQVGAGVAEGFLVRALSLTSAGIRLRKLPVFPSFSSQILAAGPSDEPEPPAEQEGPCRCTFNITRCESCIDILSSEYKTFANGLFVRMIDAGHKVQDFLASSKSCRHCFATASDHAIAGLVPKFISELVEKPELVPVMASGLLEVAVLGGLTQAPQTKKALSDK